MSRIRTLRPNVSQEEALELFSDGWANSLRTAVYGPLRSVAEFYVPFRIYQVEIENRGQSEQHVFGQDAVTGALDLYRFEKLPDPGDLIYRETRNHAEAVLAEIQGQELVVSKVQRIIFSTGFFRTRRLHIRAHAVPGEIHVPYWIGFRGRGFRAKVAVVDAVRRRVEGAKVRNLLQTWLTSVREDARG